MSISLIDEDVVQGSVTGANATASSTPTLSSPPSAGDLLVLVSLCDNAVAPQNGLAGIHGFTARTMYTSAASRWSQMAYKIADGSEAAGLSFHESNSPIQVNSTTFWLGNFGGNWGSNPLDTDTTVEITVTGVANHSISPASGESALLLTFAWNSQLDPGTPVSGMTELLDSGNGGNVQNWVGYRIVNPTSGSYTVGATLTGGAGFNNGRIQSLSFIEGPPVVARSQVFVTI